MLSPQALRGDQGQLGSRPLPEPLRPQGKAPPASRRQPRPLPFIIPHDCGRPTEVILRAGRDALKNRPKWGNALSAGKQRKSPQWDVRSELVPGGWRPQSRSRGGPASKLREGWDAVTLGWAAKREPATLGVQPAYGALSVPTLRPTLTSYRTAAVPEKRRYAPRKPTP